MRVSSPDVPVALPGVAPLRGPRPRPMLDIERDFRILVDQVETLRAAMGERRTAYFDELMKSLKERGR